MSTLKLNQTTCNPSEVDIYIKQIELLQKENNRLKLEKIYIERKLQSLMESKINSI